jgi:hypothetical protein
MRRFTADNFFFNLSLSLYLPLSHTHMLEECFNVANK